MLFACIFITCLTYFPVFGQKRCSDCIRAVSCEPARHYLHKGEVERLRLQQEFCGFSSSGAPMVCCSSLRQDAAPVTSRPHPRQHLLPNECGFIDGNRIIGGEEARLYQFPWMTLISYQTRDGPQFQCGGTLINERYVLTAAHCVQNRRLLGVRIGEHDLRTDVDCQGHGAKLTCDGNKQDKLIAKSIVHKDYDGVAKNGYDIALLRLMHPVNLDFKSAKPICLPEPQQQQRSISGENATVAGWGYTDYGFYSAVLLSVKIPILSEDRCRADRNLSQSDELRVLCAGTTGKDSCYGDSGGPLMLEGLHRGVSRYILQGVVSFGPKPCGTGRPGVYTDVSKYVNWILDNIEP